jgi:hypothetical protein
LFLLEKKGKSGYMANMGKKNKEKKGQKNLAIWKKKQF